MNSESTSLVISIDPNNAGKVNSVGKIIRHSADKESEENTFEPTLKLHPLNGGKVILHRHLNARHILHCIVNLKTIRNGIVNDILVHHN